MRSLDAISDSLAQMWPPRGHYQWMKIRTGKYILYLYMKIESGKYILYVFYISVWKLKPGNLGTSLKVRKLWTVSIQDLIRAPHALGSSGQNAARTLVTMMFIMKKHVDVDEDEDNASFERRPFPVAMLFMMIMTMIIIRMRFILIIWKICCWRWRYRQFRDITFSCYSWW